MYVSAGSAASELLVGERVLRAHPHGALMSLHSDGHLLDRLAAALPHAAGTRLHEVASTRDHGRHGPRLPAERAARPPRRPRGQAQRGRASLPVDQHPRPPPSRAAGEGAGQRVSAGALRPALGGTRRPASGAAWAGAPSGSAPVAQHGDAGLRDREAQLRDAAWAPGSRAQAAAARYGELGRSVPLAARFDERDEQREGARRADQAEVEASPHGLSPLGRGRNRSGWLRHRPSMHATG